MTDRLRTDEELKAAAAVYASVPVDFVPENSDVMSSREEYELIRILEDLDVDDLVEAPRLHEDSE